MSTPLLDVRDLAACHAGKPVIEGINLTLHPGEWFSLMGPNASGKSTLLRCITGQHVPAGGSIRIGDHCIVQSPRAARALLGYAHPPERLPDLLTPRQCVEVHAAARSLETPGSDIDPLVELMCLAPHMDQAVGSCSLGIRQKLSILLALLGSPPLLVLDEAFNGLDPGSAHRIRAHLERQVATRHCTVLLATHSSDLVLRCSTRAGLLLDGRIRRLWQTAELESLRAAGPGEFEEELVAATSGR